MNKLILLWIFFATALNSMITKKEAIKKENVIDQLSKLDDVVFLDSSLVGNFWSPHIGFYDKKAVLYYASEESMKKKLKIKKSKEGIRFYDGYAILSHQQALDFVQKKPSNFEILKESLLTALFKRTDIPNNYLLKKMINVDLNCSKNDFNQNIQLPYIYGIADLKIQYVAYSEQILEDINKLIEEDKAKDLDCYYALYPMDNRGWIIQQDNKKIWKSASKHPQRQAYTNGCSLNFSGKDGIVFQPFILIRKKADEKDVNIVKAYELRKKYPYQHRRTYDSELSRAFQMRNSINSEEI